MTRWIYVPEVGLKFPQRSGRNRVFTPEQSVARKRFQDRMSERKHRHGNFRQVWIDCAGVCIHKDENGFVCGSTKNIEFHEPFGEDKMGWNIMQARVLECFLCHCKEHPQLNGEPLRCTSPGEILAEDIQLEIWMHGGWEQWIKDFGLQDTFGRLLYA